MKAARSARPKIDQRRDGHDPGLAARDRRGDGELAVARQRVEVEALELVIGGDDARALAEQRDDDRQQAVDVVEAVRCLAAVEGQKRPEGDLDDDRDLGEAEHVPEADRRPCADTRRRRPRRPPRGWRRGR